ncbi:hypothetical protein FH972_009119 [Carpinus fangiana]|uniref:Uncharacterized protein n=1 Tax=Carpinus fangiana TaxID=176857 RepID=A0A5N6R3N3_9ROSI|nr:hypothetical protein FH972_009119 [Carpinus fangiana]
MTVKSAGVTEDYTAVWKFFRKKGLTTLRRNGWTRCSGECLPVKKTDNLAARSIRALFEGKERLPLTEVRKGLRSSLIRWKGSPESGAGALSTDCQWRSSMAWVIGSSRSAMKELAFSSVFRSKEES